MSKDSIQVGIKVRPLLPKERFEKTVWRVTENTIALEGSQSDPFCFDHVFDQSTGNRLIFEKMAKHIVHSTVTGFNGTIFAYGQTSSGKTYTMMGEENDPGVMVLAAKEIFEVIRKTSDTRQFLLRVGFIEIYNEKIYDLLNKSNQDLKIHELGNGNVSVNCHEICITSEEQLLHVLATGNKERTVGETNMNERSSRSHSILRLIIESREVGGDEDGNVTQGLLHLVDLAGSERADQTSARGTRLVEGAHINKSLLFLSTLIKRLSENNEDGKYINYRDSKLTRILQASLGGNAFTSIICTVKPNAVEETQSTLNFATSAKSVKNKPRVNEIVSDAAHMKRLEREIKALKRELEDEKRKNANQINVQRIENLLDFKEHRLINSSSLHRSRGRKDNRRRTWGSETVNNFNSNLFAPPEISAKSAATEVSRLKQPNVYFTPQVTLRSADSQTPLYMEIVDEEFEPAENFNFVKPTTPKTPSSDKKVFDYSNSPQTPDKSAIIKMIEEELHQLQEFTNLENKCGVNHDLYKTLKESFDALYERIEEFKQEHKEYLLTKDELDVLKDELNSANERYEDFQIQFSKLKTKNTEANKKIDNYESEISKLKETIKSLQLENRNAVELQFEFQRHQNKSKLRENELLELISEKDSKIFHLENQLKALQTHKLSESNLKLMQLTHFKEENENISQQQNGNESVCVKCEDLQRVLEENKQVTADFNKLTLEYQNLQLNHDKSMAEVQDAQQRIVELESTLEQYKEKTLNTQCNELRQEISELRAKLNKVETEYSQVEEQRNEKDANYLALNQELETAQQIYKELLIKYENLELTWQKQENTLASIRADYACLETKYTEFQIAYEELKQCETKCMNDCKRLQLKNDELQNEIQKLTARIERMQQELHERLAITVENENEKNKKELNMEEKIKELETQCSQFQQENEQLSMDIMDHVERNEDLLKKYTKLESELEQLKFEIAALQCEKVELNVFETKQEQFENNENAESDCFKTVTNFEINEAAAQTNWNLLKSELETEILNLKTEMANKIETITTLEVSLQTLKRENEQLNISKELLKTLETKLKILEEKQINWNLEKTEYETQNLNLKTELVSKTEMLTKLNEKIQLQESQFLNLKAELNEKTQMFANLKNQHTELETKFKIAENLQNLWNSEKSDFEAQITNLKAELIQNTKALTNIHTLEKQNEELKARNEAIIETLQTTIKNLREEIVQLSQALCEKSAFLENCSCIMSKDRSSDTMFINQFELSGVNNNNENSIVDIDICETFKSEKNSFIEEALIKIEEDGNKLLELFCDVIIKRMEVLKINDANFVKKSAEILRKNIEEKVQLFYCFDHSLAFWQQNAQYQKLIDEWIFNNNFLLSSIIEDDLRRASLGNETLCAAKELEIVNISKNESTISIETLQTALKQKEEECKSLQLELLEKLNDAENRFRTNMRQYNEDWERSRLGYEEKIQVLEKTLATQAAHTNTNSLKIENGKAAINTEDEHNNSFSNSTATTLLRQHDNNSSTPTSPLNMSRYMEMRRSHEERIEILNECQVKITELTEIIEENKNNNAKLSLALCEKTRLIEEYEKVIEERERESIATKANFEHALMKAMSERETAKIEAIVNYQTEHLRNMKIQNLKKFIESIQQNSDNVNDNDDDLKYDTKISNLLEALKNINNERNLKIQAIEKIADEYAYKTEAESIQIDETSLLQQTLNEKLTKKAEIIFDLKTQIEKMSHELDVNIETLETFCEHIKIEQVKKEIVKEFNKKLTEQEKYITTTKATNETLEKENQLKLTLLNETCEKLKKENEMLQEKLQTKLEATIRNEKLNTEHETMKIEFLNCKIQLESLRNEKNAIEQAKSTLAQELEKTQQLNSKLIEQKNENMQMLHELKQQHYNLQEKLQKLTSENELAIAALELEKYQLNQALNKCKAENVLALEKVETYNLKLETLSQQLHETKLHAENLTKTLNEYETIEKECEKLNEEKMLLQIHIDGLNLKLDENKADINMKNSLQLQFEQIKANEQILQTELKMLQTKFVDAQHAYEREKIDLQSKLKELNLQCEDLRLANLKFETLSNDYKQKFENLQTLNSVQQAQTDRITKLETENAQLLLRIKKLQTEAEQCSETYETQLQQRIEACNKMREMLDVKEKTFKETKDKLEATNSFLQEQNKILSERLDVANNIIKKYSESITSDSANNTLEISAHSTSSSSTTRRSPLNKISNINSEVISTVIQKERRNRRLSTHDENRRQSGRFTPIPNDVATMTDPIADNCDCKTLSEKIKACERNLYIKSSQVTALNLELRNNPLKLENANLIKRIQEEQQKYRTMSTKYKTKIEEQNSKMETLNNQFKIAKEALPKRSIVTVDGSTLTDFANCENGTQTESDCEVALRIFEGKYNDLKKVCRSRYNEIKELERKLSEIKTELAEKENLYNGPMKREKTPGAADSQSNKILVKKLDIKKEQLK